MFMIHIEYQWIRKLVSRSGVYLKLSILDNIPWCFLFGVSCTQSDYNSRLSFKALCSTGCFTTSTAVHRNIFPVGLVTPDLELSLLAWLKYFLLSL